MTEGKTRAAFYIDADLHELLIRLKDREGVSSSWLVNHLLREYFKGKKESLWLSRG
jgi:hypothetical protein